MRTHVWLDPGARRLFDFYRTALAEHAVCATQSRTESDTDNVAVVHTINATGGFVAVALHSPSARARAEQVMRVLSAVA
jgi:hypothetical protein